MPIILPKSDLTEKYTFKTSKKIKKDLKNYAKAKNTTIPKIINKTFEDLFIEKTLTREKNEDIIIPAYIKMTNKEIKQLTDNLKDEKIIIYENEHKKYIHCKNTWYKYLSEVYFNNCLDVWKNDTYQSSMDDRNHEGLAISYAKKRIDYIKIEQYKDDSIFAYAIKKPQAVKQAKKAKNKELIDMINESTPYSFLLNRQMRSTEKRLLNMIKSLKEREKELMKTEKERKNKIDYLKERIIQLESKIEKQ